MRGLYARSPKAREYDRSGGLEQGRDAKRVDGESWPSEEAGEAGQENGEPDRLQRHEAAPRDECRDRSIRARSKGETASVGNGRKRLRRRSMSSAGSAWSSRTASQ